ncbi:MAG: DUF512 domain-containing protein [bacterium]
MLKLFNVKKGGLAWNAGLKPYHKIISINGHKITDALDFNFHSAENKLEILFKDKENTKSVFINQNFHDDLGIEPNPMRMRRCRNRCIFCFVDQLPPGLRSSLYFKDDDYRFSFIHGNFITLINQPPDDIKKIIGQRLSPLYVSIHAVDKKVRETVFGIKEKIPIMQNLDALISGGITLHAQIVLIPGINTGKILAQTIRELAVRHPGIASIGIIPVGITNYGKRLNKIKTFPAPDMARSVIKQVYLLDKEQISLRRKHFIYLADEWFVLADLNIPASAYYKDFPQLENGIGMIRSFLNELMYLTKKCNTVSGGRNSIVTGELAKPYIMRAADKLSGFTGKTYSVHSIKNNFLGRRITVSGLLCGCDIVHQLSSVTLGQEVFLPKNCFNHDGNTLDGWSLDALSQKLGKKVKIAGKIRDLL